MAEVLELAHLAQRHGVTEVQVGARGVDAELDVEGHALLELLLELLEGDHLHGSGKDHLELFVNGKHVIPPSSKGLPACPGCGGPQVTCVTE